MAKSKKTKLPKSVAGIKVPKSVRRSSMLRMLLGSPTGRQLLARGLTAAAAAAAAVLIAEPEAVAKTGKKGAKKTAKASNIAIAAIQSAAGAMMNAVSDTAKSLVPDRSKPGDQERSARH